MITRYFRSQLESYDMAIREQLEEDMPPTVSETIMIKEQSTNILPNATLGLPINLSKSS